MKLLTAEQMREVDRQAIELIGLPGVVLMESAGRAAAEIIDARFAELRPGPLLVLAGPGNNGGDGYVVARHLLNRCWQVVTLVLAPVQKITGDASTHLQALQNSGGHVHFADDSKTLATLLASHPARLLVDALLGTGLTAEVRGVVAEGIDWIDGSALPVIALDLPSGIDASTGKVLGRAVRADLTVTFVCPKLGHALYPGAAMVGELVTADIGIPRILLDQTAASHRLIDADEARRLLPPRPVTGHKGTFGHLLVIAGSLGKSGAAALTAAAGVRAGAGLVSAACPASIQEVLAIKLTEVMTEPLPDCDGQLTAEARSAVEALYPGKDSMVLGPGLGGGEGVRALVCELLRNCILPLVLDADGLNAIAADPDILKERQGSPAVLTPHPGEMARLTGRTVSQIEADRIGVARAIARRYRVVLVLKGSRTIIALPDGQIRINSTGHQGLASGGTGDVLTGLIGGLLAQGLTPEDAATLGVFLHGLAADRLRPRMGDAGMTATDLLNELPAARHQLTQLPAQGPCSAVKPVA
jgi:NAD(P)H-hydrate epimerase